MNNDRQVAFRLPSSLVDKIDAQVEDWSANQPGMRVTRADVVRALLVRGLAENEDSVSLPVTEPEVPTRVKKEKPVRPRKAKPTPTPGKNHSTGLTLVSNSWD